jgi:transposase
MAKSPCLLQGLPTAEEEAALSVITKKLGSGPILRHYLDRMRVAPLIDAQAPLHPNRTALTHGEAVEGLMAFVLHGGRALYRVETWAEETSILPELFPQYRAEDWTDDRLGDTLDALYEAGLPLLQGSLSAHLVSEFGLSLSQIHYDTTSVSFWGSYDAQRGSPSVVLTYGHSKDHRPDLRQVVVGMAVTGDGGVPVVSEVHNGNASDSGLPLSYWERLRQVADTQSLVLIGDCKVASQKTLLGIARDGGYFLAPLPMSASEREALIARRQAGELTLLPVEVAAPQRRPTYQRRTDRPGNRRRPPAAEEAPATYAVSEEPLQLTDGEGHRVVARKLFVRSSRLAEQEEKTRLRHLSQAEADLSALSGRLNRRDLSEKATIQAAVEAILASHRVPTFLEVQGIEEIQTVRKKVGPGRPGPKSVYRTEERTLYYLEITRNERALQRAALADGFFLMTSNLPAEPWVPGKLLGLYKGQWKVESGFHVFKGPLAVAPMFLETPQRICAMMFVLTLALQLYTLIQRQVAQALDHRDIPLEGLLPNRIQTWRPQTSALLSAFETVHLVEVLEEGHRRVYVSSLTPLQREILHLLEVPEDLYSTRVLAEKCLHPG